MNAHATARRLALAAAAAAGITLAGCSMSGSSETSVPAVGRMPAPQRPIAAEVGASVPLLYASLTSKNTVLIYDEAGTNQQPIGTLTTGLKAPAGLAVAANHDLYVANEGTKTVLVFHRGATSPFKTLTDPGFIPTELVVDSGGTVFVSDVQPRGGARRIAVYAGGSTSPTSTLTMPANKTVGVPTIDLHHNLFVNYVDSHIIDHVAKFVNEMNPAVVTGISVVAGQGMLVNGKNQVVIVDSGVPGVAIWPAPYRTLLKTCAASGKPRGLALSTVHDGYFVADVQNATIEEHRFLDCSNVDTIKAGLSTTNPATHLATDKG